MSERLLTPGLAFPKRRVSRQTAREICTRLAAAYPDAVTALDFTTPFTLLIAVILSAQTTDVMVNNVTPDLFARYPDASSLSNAEFDDVDALIRRLGFHATKARNIIATAKLLMERHGGEVPATREALEALPGVGRKTASVVLAVAFEEAAFAVDTHVFRVSQRLGLAFGKTPLEIETQVTKIVPREDWRHAHHWLILHGRQICKAPVPACASCFLTDICPSFPIVKRAMLKKLAAKKAVPRKKASAPKSLPL